jgi:hypothetical protein
MSPDYPIWNAIISRCENKKNQAYRNYGGRGIKICKRWRTSFSNFIADMGPRPSRKHSIERLNNNKGYYKANCIWATKKEQDRNRRNNVWVTYNGTRMIATDCASKIGVSSKLFLHHIKTKTIQEIIEFYKNRNGTGKKGVNSISIAQINIETNEIIKKYNSITEASSETGVSKGNICACARGDRSRAGKFKWNYV